MVARIKPTKPPTPEPIEEPRLSGAKQCRHCGHWYVYPCFETGAEQDCANYAALQEKAKPHE